MFEFGKRGIEWVPKPYSKVTRAPEKIRSDSVDGVP